MPPASRALRASLPSLALLLLITAPFAGRPHHMDDPLYLEAASHVRAAPADPLGGPSFWHDRPGRLFDDLYNPPLIAYLLALLPGATAQGSEIVVHAFMILLAAAALVAVTWAGQARGVPPRWTLLLACSPALATASVSAMADVPFLLLTVLGWGAALRGRATTGGLMAGLSALTKYAGLLNVPLALVALGRTSERKRIILLAVAVLPFGAWCAFNLATQGQLHLTAAARFQTISWRHQGELALSLVAALGLAGLPAALGLLRWTRVGIGAALLAGGLGSVFVHARGAGSVNAGIAFAAFASGAALLVAAGRATQASLRSDPFAAVCFWSFSAYAAFFVYFGATRYLLPLLPPLLWLLIRDDGLAVGRLRFAVSIAAASALSLLVLWGDSGYAEAWRTAAGRLPHARRALEVGHWGFQWYAGYAGYNPLDPRVTLEPGAVVARAAGIHGPAVSPAVAAPLQLLDTLMVPSPWLRVMDRNAEAGLYSSAWGLLPFGVRGGAYETVRIETPAAWLLAAAAAPPTSLVSVDLGSEEARHVLLDGWSGDEAFTDAGGRTTFVWAVGPESALRLPLPAGADRVSLRAAPSDAAVGPLHLQIGRSAWATIDLRPGWQVYEAHVNGSVSGGLTTVVLRPSGSRRTGGMGGEDRPLSVAVDFVAFGAATGDGNQGVWPVATSEGPALFVARSEGLIFEGAGGGVRGRVRVLAGSAELSWPGSDTGPAFAAAAPACATGCAFDLPVPPGGGPLRLRADRALALAVEATPGPP